LFIFGIFLVIFSLVLEILATFAAEFKEHRRK